MVSWLLCGMFLQAPVGRAGAHAMSGCCAHLLRGGSYETMHGEAGDMQDADASLL